MEITDKIGGAGFTMSAFITAAAALFNRVPTLLILFMIAVVVDYLTGWIKAAFFLKEWSSKPGYKGL